MSKAFKKAMSDIPEISDPKRLRAVKRTGLVDSAPEVDFDRLAQIAARLLGAPAAFVTVIDQDRQYLKSAVENGAATDAAGTSTELDRSFCKHTVAANEPFVVEDARVHPLVKNNKAVEEGVIAYAGVPFKSPDGQPVGALCVVDSRPREWSAEDIENLRTIGRAASNLVRDREGRDGVGPSSTQADEEDGIISSAAAYLRAERDYSRLLQGSRELDMEAEAQARANLVACLTRLRRAHEARDASGGTHPELFDCVGRYLDAEAVREELAGAFAAGAADLPTLEGAIQRQMDAADALRICASDYGIDL